MARCRCVRERTPARFALDPESVTGSRPQTAAGASPGSDEPRRPVPLRAARRCALAAELDLVDRAAIRHRGAHRRKRARRAAATAALAAARPRAERAMRNRDGYALIAALWFLVLGSAISLEAAHAARKHRLLAAGLAEGAQARVAAAAGVEHARARLACAPRGA